MLVVPSVVARAECNAVVNPAHPDAGRLVVSAPQPVVWDQRLFAGGPDVSPNKLSRVAPPKQPDTIKIVFQRLQGARRYRPVRPYRPSMNLIFGIAQVVAHAARHEDRQVVHDACPFAEFGPRLFEHPRDRFLRRVATETSSVATSLKGPSGSHGSSRPHPMCGTTG